MSRPTLHWLLYGDPGSKKSTMAASFPKPMLVFMFDPYGKELPYVRRGARRDGKVDAHGTPITEVMSRRNPDDVIVRIEHYLDADFKEPEAYSRYLERMTNFQEEYGQWATVVMDSVTFAELTARKWHQYVLNPGTKHPMQWFAGSTDLVEEMLLGRLASLPMNVVVVSHVDEDKDEMHGTFVRSPKMPGKRLRGGVAAGYAEMYHLSVKREGGGEIRWAVQTVSDTMWNCATQIPAPDGCGPDYQELWAEYDKENPA